MAQTLAVYWEYHYGYYNLKAGQVRSHESALVPSDTAAVRVEPGCPLHFAGQAPAIAMVVTMSEERSLRRYRLVVAQKSRLRLVPEVLATFASHGRDHRLTASGVFPCLLIGYTCMVMLRMDTARPFGCALPIMETPCLFIYNEAPKCSSTEHFRTESSL